MLTVARGCPPPRLLAFQSSLSPTPPAWALHAAPHSLLLWLVHSGTRRATSTPELPRVCSSSDFVSPLHGHVCAHGAHVPTARSLPTRR